MVTRFPRRRFCKSVAAFRNCLVLIIWRNFQLYLATAGVTMGPLVCKMAAMMFLLDICELERLNPLEWCFLACGIWINNQYQIGSTLTLFNHYVSSLFSVLNVGVCLCGICVSDGN